MSKAKTNGDLKLLLTGVISLILAIVFSIITVAVFALQLAQKAGETDWNAVWSQFNEECQKIEYSLTYEE